VRGKRDCYTLNDADICACPTQDISFLTNRAAVFFEQGKLDECITDCDSAVTKAYEVHADFKARMHIA